MRIGHHHRPTAAPAPAPAQYRYRGQKGFTLVMFGLLLVPLLLMVSFSVDVGYWYNRASQMQKAADAAALAGVVWLPNEATADSVAKDVAKRNGFDDAATNIRVEPSRSTISTRRLLVKVCDDQVGSFFYKQLTGKQIKLCRKGFAEYVLPVPLGSPRNFFGLGPLPTGFPSEYLYQSVNPYCTDKYDGDRYQSARFGNSGGGGASNCTGGVANTEYNGTTGYELYVEVPAVRSSGIQIRLYDPSYNDTCVSGTYTYSNWGKVNGDNGYDDYGNGQATFSGPGKQYWNGSDWIEIGSGTTVKARYWRTARSQQCTGPDGAPDSKWGGTNSDEAYTWSLFSADSTPLDDTDNPLLCTQTFTKNTPTSGYTYLGSTRWNDLCAPISTGMPKGRYIVRVHNAGASSSPIPSGSNQWGIVARYTGASGTGLCDGIAEPPTARVCPRVFGKEAISVYANTLTNNADFYLAEIEAEHAGKTLKIELWDPGEGGSLISFKRPVTATSWGSPASFTWKSFNNDGSQASSGSGTSLDVTGSKFNGKRVEITISLTGYAPPANNSWWKIHYEFAGDDSGVHDRTTWSARVIGDPVHLVEEY